VEGGGISLGQTGQTDGAAQLAGSVYVQPGGMFTGNGKVGGDLTSSGLLFPGLSDTPGSVLQVDGAALSSGELRLRLWGDGSSNLLRSDTANIDGTRVSIAGMEGGYPLPGKSYVYQVIQTSTSLDGTPVNSTATAMQGVTLLHNFSLSQDNQNLYAAYADSAAAPQAKALSEGFLGGLALVNQGADAIAGQGMESAVRSARAARGDIAGGYGLATFGTLSGGWSRYNTGSHVDMSSFSLMTGLSRGLELSPGYLTLGAFFEYGNGSYNTYNSFSNAASVKGGGDMYYIGGGVLGRMDFTNSGPGHFYAEAAGRAGGLHNEYSSGDLRDNPGRKADYDSSSAYYGLHLGAGYVWNLSEKASLDLYGKYFWTHQEGDSVTLSTNDPVKFEAADSQRLRGGARFAYAVNEYVSPYIGAAYEHEFDGRVLC
jgi:hypothetical protein